MIDPSIYEISRGKGIIHVGASTGQEKNDYIKYNLDVIWFEPQPGQFKTLQASIARLPKQQAYQYAVLDEDDGEYPFYVLDYQDSSSLLEPAPFFYDLFHQKVVNTIRVMGISLDTFFKRSDIDPSKFQILHVDTQGAELPVFKGATGILPFIKFIEVEIADFEVYKNCSRLTELESFLAKYGFKERKRLTLPQLIKKLNHSELLSGLVTYDQVFVEVVRNGKVAWRTVWETSFIKLGHEGKIVPQSKHRGDVRSKDWVVASSRNLDTRREIFDRDVSAVVVVVATPPQPASYGNIYHIVYERE